MAYLQALADDRIGCWEPAVIGAGDLDGVWSGAVDEEVEAPWR